MNSNKIVLVAFLMMMMATIIACTENQRARQFGGTETVNLPAGQELVNITWKGEEASLWILTTPMDSTHVPKTYQFKEKSGFGQIEGTVVIVESR